MENWKKQLANRMTYARMLMVPIVIALLWPNEVLPNILAALVFIAASITDYYDGYFARKYNSVSTLGQFLDPIADKILVTSILVVMVALQKIDPFMVVIILARDTLIGGLRSIAAAEGVIIAAKPTGKWKTALQMIAIPALMIDTRVIGIPFDIVGYWVLWFSVILSVLSGLEYARSYTKTRKP